MKQKEKGGKKRTKKITFSLQSGVALWGIHLIGISQGKEVIF